MENEIKDFQENLNRDEDSAYFRQLEADRLRREFQLATNKTFFWLMEHLFSCEYRIINVIFNLSGYKMM